MNTRRRQGGFTILELVVTLGLGLVLLAAAYGVYLSQHRGYERIGAYSHSAQSARLALEQVARELRVAGFGVVTGETFTEAKRYAITFLGDVDADIAGTLAAAATAGDTDIAIDLRDGRDVVEPGEFVFINGGGHVESIAVADEAMDVSGEPDTIHLASGLANGYAAGTTLLRTIEQVRFEVTFPGGELRRNNVLLADGLRDMEFHYFRDDGTEMVPDAVTGLNQLQRAAARRVELRLSVGAAGQAAREYTESIELRNMGTRPFSPDTCAPNPPTNVVVAASDTCRQFRVTWTAPATNACDGQPLTDLGGYKIFYGEGADSYFMPAANVADETLTEYTVEDPRLANNQTYYLRMVAFDRSFNESATTAETSFLLLDESPPEAPEEIDATAGVGQVTLSWDEAEAVDVVGYRLYRATESPVGISPTNRIVDETALPVGTLTYVDTDVEACTTYYYSLSAIDCANEGEASEEIHGDGTGEAADAPNNGVTTTTPLESPAVPPAAPAPFQAIGRDQAVELMWNNPSAADFASVEIRFSRIQYPANPNDGERLDRFFGSASQAMTTIHENLVNGTAYYYAAFASDRCGNVSASARATATPNATGPVVEVTTPLDGQTVENGRMSFAARAYDPDQPGVSEPPNIVTDNGKGIAQILFYVTPDTGTAQFPRTEYLAEYCGFGGDSAPCPQGDVTLWCDGTYQAYAVATDDEGVTTASPYVTVHVRNGGVALEESVVPALGGTYNNTVTFTLANTAADQVTISAITATWDKPQARLRQVEMPSGTAVWSSSTAPVASGQAVTFPTYSRPTIAGDSTRSVRLTFTAMFTTLSSAALAGESSVRVASTAGFAAGDTIHVVGSLVSEAATVASVASGQLNLAAPLAHAYGYGATVRHPGAADDVTMTGTEIRLTVDYKKTSLVGQTCTSDEMTVSLSPAPLIHEAAQDQPAADTTCVTVPGQLQVENHRAVPVHVEVTDQASAGIAEATAHYAVDTIHQDVAPTSGYASVTLAYESVEEQWQATIPMQTDVRVWLYFTVTDGNGQTDRDPAEGAYTYDYVPDSAPPACPLGLYAVKVAKKEIDLSWNANTEVDLAGYNVYRSADCGVFGKVYTLVSDTDAGTPGVQFVDDDNRMDATNICYTYYVTAVDLQGNESTSCTSYTSSAGDCPCP